MPAGRCRVLGIRSIPESDVNSRGVNRADAICQRETAPLDEQSPFPFSLFGSHTSLVVYVGLLPLITLDATPRAQVEDYWKPNIDYSCPTASCRDEALQGLLWKNWEGPESIRCAHPEDSARSLPSGGGKHLQHHESALRNS